jgi:hypothetical protein
MTHMQMSDEKLQGQRTLESKKGFKVKLASTRNIFSTRSQGFLGHKRFLFFGESPG